jgi:hypothetical protein
MHLKLAGKLLYICDNADLIISKGELLLMQGGENRST